MRDGSNFTVWADVFVHVCVQTGGLKGGKGQNYEGGIRMPAIAYWPGRIAEGVVLDTLVKYVFENNDYLFQS